jgi:hypothetical protein
MVIASLVLCNIGFAEITLIEEKEFGYREIWKLSLQLSMLTAISLFFLEGSNLLA